MIKEIQKDKKSVSVKDSEAHYDVDGVSLSNDGVVVSGDNQTTENAPPPQNFKLAPHAVDRNGMRNEREKSPKV